MKDLLGYDPGTGELRWIVSRGRAKAGDVAGSVRKDGYRELRISGKPYLAHRVAWLLWTGGWPKNQIDHINGDKDDNCIENLRDVSQHINQQNRSKPMANNTVGLLGVLPPKTYRGETKYGSCIRVNNKQKWVGSFDTPEEAHAAYMKAKAELHGSNPAS